VMLNEKIEVRLRGRKRDKAWQREGWLDCLCLFTKGSEAYERIQNKIREWDKVK
jgi:hypothetical protein